MPFSRPAQPSVRSGAPSQVRGRRLGGRPLRRISAILRGLAVSGRQDMTVGDISVAFEARAFGAFLILFGGLNLIPLPPGASFVAGVPLLIVSLQLAFGRRRLWLPERIRRLKLSPELLGKLMARLGPPLRRIERLARHRWWPEADGMLGPSIGWFTLVLTIPVLIPMPLTNLLPGFGIALLGIGLTARDGLWLAAGFMAGLASLILLTVLYAATTIAFLSMI